MGGKFARSICNLLLIDPDLKHENGPIKNIDEIRQEGESIASEELKVLLIQYDHAISLNHILAENSHIPFLSQYAVQWVQHNSIDFLHIFKTILEEEIKILPEVLDYLYNWLQDTSKGPHWSLLCNFRNNELNSLPKETFEWNVLLQFAIQIAKKYANRIVEDICLWKLIINNDSNALWCGKGKSSSVPLDFENLLAKINPKCSFAKC